MKIFEVYVHVIHFKRAYVHVGTTFMLQEPESTEEKQAATKKKTDDDDEYSP